MSRPASGFHRGTHRFAMATAVATWLLLGAGALVTGTGSGLAVPDWPLSFGTLLPPMKGGVLFEHGHRLIAGMVALLTLALAFFLSRYEPRAWVRRLGWIAFGLVLTQASLGGLTVLLRLPPVVSVAHACLAQIFFCVVSCLVLATSKTWLDEWPRTAPRGISVLAGALAALFFLQLFLGASMRHLGAGLAIPDFPLSFGEVVPSHWTSGIALHYAHRVGAAFLFCGVLGMAAWVYRAPGVSLRLVAGTGALVVLVLFQGTLGAVVIWAGRPVIVTTLHLMVGALCLMTSVLVTVCAFRVESAAAAERRETMAAGAIAGASA